MRGVTVQQLGKTPDPTSVFGTPEHAARETEGRDPQVREILQWMTYAHLPNVLRRYSSPFYYAAVELLREIRTDGPELIGALNKLVEAKDCAVRAGIRHRTGRAGSIPRP